MKTKWTSNNSSRGQVLLQSWGLPGLQWSIQALQPTYLIARFSEYFKHLLLALPANFFFIMHIFYFCVIEANTKSKRRLPHNHQRCQSQFQRFEHQIVNLQNISKIVQRSSDLVPIRALRFNNAKKMVVHSDRRRAQTVFNFLARELIMEKCLLQTWYVK